MGSRLARLGFTVSVVDEVLQMAMQLESRLLEAVPDAASLAREETLLRLLPMDEAVSKADLLVFAPRLRSTPEEARSEVTAHLRSVGGLLKKRCCFLNLLPSGLGDGGNSLALIERLCGLTPGENFVYAYAPREGLVGSNPTKLQRGWGYALRAAGRPPSGEGLRGSEARHVQYAIAELAAAASELEVIKLSQAGGGVPGIRQSRFIDEVADVFYDVKLLMPTLEPGTPLFQLASGSVKSLSGYPRYLAERVKAEAKVAGWRLSHLRVLLAWTTDSFECRPERRHLQSELENRLRDLVDTVVVAGQQEHRSPWPEAGAIVAVACSADDYRRAPQFHPTAILKADMMCGLTLKR